MEGKASEADFCHVLMSLLLNKTTVYKEYITVALCYLQMNSLIKAPGP